MTKRVLLTGHGGFVGHHCLEYFLEHTDWEFVCLDSFRHKGTCRRVVEVGGDHPRVKTYKHDLSVPIDPQLENLIFERWIDEKGLVRDKPIHLIINMASESAVERSTIDPVSCLHNNWHLAINMLEFAPKCEGLAQFVPSSSDDAFVEALEADVHPAMRNGHRSFHLILMLHLRPHKKRWRSLTGVPTTSPLLTPIL